MIKVPSGGVKVLGAFGMVCGAVAAFSSGHWGLVLFQCIIMIAAGCLIDLRAWARKLLLVLPWVSLVALASVASAEIPSVLTTEPPGKALVLALCKLLIGPTIWLLYSIPASPFLTRAKVKEQFASVEGP